MVYIKNLLCVVDSELETSRTPLDEIERGLGLESRSRNRTVAGNNITTIQESHRHILSVAWIAYNHLVVRFEAFPSHYRFQNIG
jgi:hypothetical protein